MRQDIRGLEVTTRSNHAVALLDAAIDAVMEHRADAGALVQRCLAVDPGMVLAQALRGLSCKILARRELDTTAREAFDAARQALVERGGTLRERAAVRALGFWLEGDMRGAANALAAANAAEPGDLLLLKLGYAIRFMLGDTEAMRAMMELALPSWRRDMPGYGYVKGLYAFALEETGEHAAALRFGQAAVEMNPADAWAVHAVAHVQLAHSHHARGIAWLSNAAKHLGRVGNFGRHLAWHRALFHLARGEQALVLDLYDRAIRDEPTEDFRDVANATSLLARLDIAGVDVGKRWDELAGIATRRAGDISTVFAALHYLVVLAARAEGGAALGTNLRAIRFAARRFTGTQSSVLRDVGLGLAEFIAARARGDHRRAADRFMSVRAKLIAIGGSHAQRDVFIELAQDSARRAGLAGTERILDEDRFAA
jgi:tetratricopeptide (TPR) repeat protein